MDILLLKSFGATHSLIIFTVYSMTSSTLRDFENLWVSTKHTSDLYKNSIPHATAQSLEPQKLSSTKCKPKPKPDNSKSHERVCNIGISNSKYYNKKSSKTIIPLGRWENEQMKKGVGFGTGAPDLTSVDPINEVVQEKCAVDDYIPKFVMPDISIAAIENEIIGEINSLKLVLSENEMDLKSTVDALEASEANIAKYETKTVELSSGFTFYQQTKGYINDYSHLLSLKIEAIEQVEVDIYTLFGKKCNDARDARRLLQQKLSVQLGIIKSQVSYNNRL